MAGLLLPLLLLVGGYIWYTKFNGKQTIDGIFNEIKSVGSGGGGSSNSGGNFSSSGFEDLKNGRTGQWTDERGNKFNVQKDSNSQSNTGSNGKISQKQSSSFYTIPRFGNL
jgi:hypothetical protein